MSRVLMVDDAGLFRAFEASFLRRTGCEILRARDGPDILRKASDGSPGLILLDSQKVNLDGPGCVRALKADPSLRFIPVVIVTTKDAAQACCDAGADATLTRPLEVGALELALASLDVLSHRRAVRRGIGGWVHLARHPGAKRGRLKDISRTGLFMSLTEPLPVGERIDLSLRLPRPRGGTPIHARSVVVRQVLSDPDSHLIPGVGVRFLEIDARDQGQIDQYVNESVEAASPIDEGAPAGRSDP